MQIHGNSVKGRMLHGNSPSELIESFTESIGRPPQLPDWIISGAVVGMQGGTEKVRQVWNELGTYNVPVSAVWLQVIHASYINCTSESTSILYIDLHTIIVTNRSSAIT